MPVEISSAFLSVLEKWQPIEHEIIETTEDFGKCHLA